MATRDVTSSSGQVATQVAANTGTSGGSAGNNTASSEAEIVATLTPVAAPKGYRQELQHMLQGWQELIRSDAMFPSSAGTLTGAAVVAKLQGYLGAYNDLDTHVTGASLARAQVAKQLQEVQAYQGVLKAAMISNFGAQNPQLVKFGLKPKKTRTPLNATQLAVRAAKVMATRKLRGTMGSAQKRAIKSGPMQLTVQPATSVGQVATRSVTAVASTAPPDPTLGNKR